MTAAKGRLFVTTAAYVGNICTKYLQLCNVVEVFLLLADGRNRG